MKNRKYCKDTFTAAGISTDPKGRTKVRFSNDRMWTIKRLHRGGHTDIDLRDLPSTMTKAEATNHLYRNEQFDEKFAGIIKTTYEKYNVVKVKRPRGRPPKNKAQVPAEAKTDSKEKQPA